MTDITRTAITIFQRRAINVPAPGTGAALSECLLQCGGGARQSFAERLSHLAEDAPHRM